MNSLNFKSPDACSDSSLTKLGELIIPVSSYSSLNVFGPISFSGVSIDDFDIDGDLQYCDSAGTVQSTKPTAFGFYLSTVNGSGNMHIQNKYNLTSLFSNSSGWTKVNGVHLNLKELEYLTNITALYIQGKSVEGDVYYLRNTIGSPTEFQSIGYQTKIEGDLSYLPSAVVLIYGTGYIGSGFNWTSGRRTGSSKKALFLRDDIEFKTQTELCNFLLDNATCTPKLVQTAGGVNNSIETVSLDGVTTLPANVKTAMAMMCAASTIANASSVTGYCWGLTTLKVNGITYTSQDGINLDQ